MKYGLPEETDIDLTLVSGETLTLSIFIKTMDDIDDLLLPYEVDLSILHLIPNQEVLAHIRRVGILF